MAITAPTKTSDFAGFLSPHQAAPIFDKAEKQSVFQRLFPRIPLGINGEVVPVVTSKPTANWVAEAGKKPAAKVGLGLVPMKPQKLAAIAVMSAEVVRANPGDITSRLRTGLASAFATAFDLAVGYGLGGDGTGTGPFDHHLSETTKSVEIGTATQANGGIHADLTAVLSLLVTDGKKLTGWALDDAVEPKLWDAVEPKLWGAVDTSGRPLYVDLPTDDVSHVDVQADGCPFKPGGPHILGLQSGPPTEHCGNPQWDGHEVRTAIKTVQQRLIALGYAETTNPSWADGIYEQPTVDAVARWQRQTGRLESGRIGYGDWQALNAETVEADTRASGAPYALPEGHAYGLVTGPTWMRGGHPTDPQSVRDAITRIQRRLIETGCMPGISDPGSTWADGVYEEPTAQAVRRHQSGHGLEVDGLVGPITWRELGL